MSVPRGPTVNEPASLLDIQNEFLGSAPISLSEYYAGGGLVRNPPPTSVFQQGGVPTSGQISIGNFLGLRRIFVFNDVVSSNLASYDLNSRALSAGWSGVDPMQATVTINAGVYVSVWSNTRTGGYPAGTTISLFNFGLLIGPGGAGGPGGRGDIGTPGGGGGQGGTPLFITSWPVDVYNYGLIAGGGGGGGGGGADTDGKSVVLQGGGGGGGRGFGGGPGGAGGPTAGGWSGGANGASGPNVAASGVGIGIFNAGGFGGTNGGGVGGAVGQFGFPGGGGTTAGGGGGQRGSAIAASVGSNIRWRHSGNIQGLMGLWGVNGVPGGVDNTSLIQGYVSNVQQITRHGAWFSGFGDTWFWRDGGSGSAGRPTGDFTYRMIYTNNEAAGISAALFGCVDDTVVALSINGSGFSGSLNLGSPNTTSAFTLQRGVNVISMTIRNTGGQAGFFVFLRTTTNGSTLLGPENWFYA